MTYRILSLLKCKTVNIYLPSRGTDVDVCGMVSEIIIRKTTNESKTVMERETFSPAGAGTRKVKSCRVLSIMQGRIMLRM